jgi:hypothetical protein
VRTFALLLIPALLAVAARGEDLPTHTGVVTAGAVEVRYRPGSRAGAAAPHVAAAAAADLRWIRERLDLEPQQRVVLYLYDDVQALQALTGRAGVGGYSDGEAVHVPYDNDQTRRHELVHLIGHRLEKTGEEPRNRFFDDGLANAVLEYVHGVHVHAVAAFYRARGTLPTLSEMVKGDFYAWQAAHPELNGYDIAGSFVRFLLDTYGAKRVKRYLTGTPIRRALGQDFATVETRWLKALDAYETPPEVVTLLRQRVGEAAGFTSFTEALWKARMGTEDEWTSLTDRALKSDDVGSWSREGEAIVVTNDATAWSACELGTETYGNCVVRVRIRTPAPCPIQVRLGEDNQAMLVNGTFLYRKDQSVASSAAAVMGPGRRETDLVLVRLGETIEVWVDGARVLVAPAAGGPAAVGIGIYRGRASFESVRVRRLP